MKIRIELQSDIPQVEEVNKEAFEQINEAVLVNNLRENSAVLSLVAEDGISQIIGHIMFSRISIVSNDGSEFPAVALAPMAVLNKYQGSGIGSRLVKEGLIQLKQMDEMIVIVLGHPWFYPKFGFEPAEQFGIKPPFNVGNPKAWMVYYLENDLKGQVEGTVRYPKAFSEG